MTTPEASQYDAHSQLASSIGHIVLGFGRLEWFMRRHVQALTGLEPQTLTALLGHPGIDKLGGVVRRLVRQSALGEAAKREVIAALDQLKLIERLRNNLVHHGANPADPGKILIRKKGELSTQVPPIDVIVEPQYLMNAYLDLQRIEWTLLVHLDPEISPEMREALQASLHGPWRYKPA